MFVPVIASSLLLSAPDSNPAAVVAMACGIVALVPSLELMSSVVAVVVPMLRLVDTFVTLAVFAVTALESAITSLRWVDTQPGPPPS